jgi:hypothetical protein
MTRTPYDYGIEVIVCEKLEQFNRCFYAILKRHFDIHKDNLILASLFIESGMNLLLASLARESEFNDDLFFFKTIDRRL